MKYYVYLLVSKNINKIISYVGYTNDLKKRLIDHNSSKGAKFTRGRQWQLAFSKVYFNRSNAMKAEYKLKKDLKLRNKIKNNFLFE